MIIVITALRDKMAARGNALLEFRLGERREGKLDALLRKELSALDYERVVATEVCVCVFPRGKKVHGHVVLEGNYLTFVPIPVKKAQRLTKLIDIVSTSMVCRLIKCCEFFDCLCQLG